MVKTSLFWIYRAATIALWVFSIALLLSVSVLRYLVLPQIEAYKTEIAQSISQAIGQKTTIGQIEAGWDGLNPHLNLREVTVLDKQNRAVLSLHHVESSLSWWSIPLLEPRLSELTIYQPALTIRRAPDGKLTIAGIAIGGATKSNFPNWLLHQAKINVLDATVLWQDDLRHAPALTLNHLHLRLDSPLWGSLFGQHRFALRATPSAGSSQPIDIRGRIYGHDVHQPEQWRGTLYASLDGTDMAAWRNWVVYPVDLHEGSGATRFWLDFSKGKPVKITTDVSLSKVKVRLANQAAATQLNQLSGRLIWTKFADGQQIQAQRLRLLATGDIDLKNGKFSLRERMVAGKSQQEGEIQLDEVQLETLAAFVAQLPLPPAFLQKMAEITPVGKLQKFALSWKGNQFLPQEYSLRSRFSGLGMKAQESFPGFSQLSGNIEANAGGGTLNLDTHLATLDFQKILRWPMGVDKLSGKIQWSKRANGTLIDIKSLSIANPQLAGIINASYLHTGNHNDTIDLIGKFERLDGKFAYLYFPMTLHENTMDWLDNAFVDGSASDINIIVKGKLAAYPWIDNQQGLLQIKAKVTDGIINYSKVWPRVEGVRAELLVEGDRLQVKADAGQLSGNQIIKTQVLIPHLKTLHKVVEISADLQSPAEALLQFIKNSPLAAGDDGFIGNLQASGAGKLSLDLMLPLEAGGVGAKVKGSYVLNNGKFARSAKAPVIEQILLEQINGRLDFTEASLKAQNVNARIFGSTVQFNLANVNADLLRVTAKGQMPESAVRQAIARPLANKLQGNIDWTGEFNLGKHQADFSIKSSLLGFSSSLPPPFNKRADEALALRFDKTSQGAQQDTISFNLGAIVSAKFIRNLQAGAMSIARGEINLGGNAEIPAASGLQLKGVLASLDVDQWQALLGEPGNGENNIAVNTIDLKIAELDWFGRRINALKLNAKATADGWQANVQSREIDGNVFWLSTGNGKVVGRLQSLVMPVAAPAKLRDADFVLKKERKYPALDIEAKAFSLGKKPLGRLELQANEQNGNWHIEQLRISNADSVLSADGDWQSWKLNPVTQMHFNYAISNVGNALERLGYANTIKDGEADFSGQLNWPGSPHTFDLEALNGDFKLEAKKGQFLKVKSGFGRFLGIISLQSLPRRLLFDFRDLYNDGVSFDNISANVSIKHGVLRSEDFKLESPSALVEIKGETDLHKETQHLNIKATPHMSDTFSLAALAGGPAVAGAVFLAQKLFKDPLSKLAIERYEIVGTWDNPQEVKDSK
ncbi:MAG: YhdP family protein [Methylophilaceae bacterium]